MEWEEALLAIRNNRYDKEAESQPCTRVCTEVCKRCKENRTSGETKPLPFKTAREQTVGVWKMIGWLFPIKRNKELCPIKGDYRIVPHLYDSDFRWKLERYDGEKWEYVRTSLFRKTLRRLAQHMNTKPEYL